MSHELIHHVWLSLWHWRIEEEHGAKIWAHRRWNKSKKVLVSITSVIAPWSLVLNKPVNPEQLFAMEKSTVEGHIRALRIAIRFNSIRNTLLCSSAVLFSVAHSCSWTLLLIYNALSTATLTLIGESINFLISFCFQNSPAPRADWYLQKGSGCERPCGY